MYKLTLNLKDILVNIGATVCFFAALLFAMWLEVKGKMNQNDNGFQMDDMARVKLENDLVGTPTGEKGVIVGIIGKPVTHVCLLTKEGLPTWYAIDEVEKI